MVLMIFLFIFGIICVNYFKGQFYKCDYLDGKIAFGDFFKI